MVSKKWLYFRIVWIFLALAGVLISLTTEPGSLWRWLAWLHFAASVIAHYLCSRCPHCRKHGLRFSFSGADPGYCSKCGKRVVYEENIE